MNSVFQKNVGGELGESRSRMVFWNNHIHQKLSRCCKKKGGGQGIFWTDETLLLHYYLFGHMAHTSPLEALSMGAQQSIAKNFNFAGDEISYESQ